VFDFDAEALTGHLDGLGPWSQAVFCAACVEVVVPAYRTFCAIE
jgi:uncharacterized protein YjaG (DUF416 family)